MELRDFFRFYRGLPHQDAAIKQLQDAMPAALLTRDADWCQTWQAGGKQEDLSQALQLIKEFEGCQLKAYPDPLSGGDPWTIGYGTTRINGKPVPHDLTITQAKADQLLEAEVREFADHISGTIPHWGEMTSNQRCALISFAYNLGAGFYGASGFETISHTLHHRLWDQVPDAMMLYRNPGSNVEAGLKRRRKAEGELWKRNRKQETGKFTPTSSFAFKVTPNITYGEFALNENARRFVKQHQCDTALELAQFMEKARAAFGGKPLIITSGYRPPAINAAVGGASQSEHLYDAPDTGAVDFYIDGVDVYQLQNWCDRTWLYSLGYGAPKGFVHLGIRPGRRKIRWDY